MGLEWKYDLEFAKGQIAELDRIRFRRALSGSSEEFQHIFQLISLLLHCNHPQLPGYVENAPEGVCQFELSDYQHNYLKINFPSTDFIQNVQNLDRTFCAINGVYCMGSSASICQTSSSDLDIWVCHREDLLEEDKERLAEKALKLQQWAKSQEVDLNLFLMEQSRFRSFRYAEPMTAENCGTTQYMLLLDEFYRSAIRLAGKPLLWLHLLVDNEQDYENEVAKLVENNQLCLQDWVDFGGLGALSANEYFGAGLWHLYKGIDAPHKAVIKILLLEAYSHSYPHTDLISSQFKRELLTEQLENPHHFDPYLAMLQRVEGYLIQQKDLTRLEIVRQCFYLKASEDMWFYREVNWRFELLQDLVCQWHWSAELVDELKQRLFWKVKRVRQNYNNIVAVLMASYRHLVSFARKQKIDASIIPQDLNILMRKLYTAFEELPGKVNLLNLQISRDLSEAELTFIEVKESNNAEIKKGWYLVNQAPKVSELSPFRYVEYSSSLNKLVAWAYFNGLLTAETQIYLSSETLNLDKLLEFIADLRTFFPLTPPSISNDDLNHSCEIRQLAVIINLTNDPTQNLPPTQSNEIQQSDLFSFGATEQSLVGRVDLLYRNLWNEIRTLHFEGPNAILLALKVLSNKIPKGSTSLQSVRVFCYSQQYRQSLGNIVSLLVDKCINIQSGKTDAPKLNNILRVAGKNWQFFFEERGISLQEVCGSVSPERELDEQLHQKVVENLPHFSSPKEEPQYPVEIDSFASEGFLQFFFQDNNDGSFNVYLLDERNHLEIYRRCDGDKEDKIREINLIYQSASQNGNPYQIVQKDFNYPQFYQLFDENDCTQIRPFRFQNSLE
ncbi:MAG: class I adenylate cyclase [Lonepinella koalarum]|nr:class I adenylate cyclase [Lonepinella koalarum]